MAFVLIAFLWIATLSVAFDEGVIVAGRPNLKDHKPLWKLAAFFWLAATVWCMASAILVDRDRSQWVIAGASCAVAALTCAEFARREAEQRERTESANDHVQLIAFALRRQIRSWLGVDIAPDQPDLKAWKERELPGAIDASLSAAEARVHEIGASLRDVSPDRRRFLEEAFVTFYSATRRLNEYRAKSRPREMVSQMRWNDLIKGAQAGLLECVESLEGAIDPELLATESQAEKRRAAESTMERLRQIYLEGEEQAPSPPESPQGHGMSDT